MSSEDDHNSSEWLGALTGADDLWLADSLCDDHEGDRIAASDPAAGQI